MAYKDINLCKGGRIVLEGKQADIYLSDPLPVYNFTGIDNLSQSGTMTSGTLLVGTFPASGISLLNRELGGFGDFNLATSGINRFSSIYDIQYKRSGIPISGTKNVGRF